MKCGGDPRRVGADAQSGVRNKTGFGFLRLPRLDADDEKSVDEQLLSSLVDRFLELGGTYFDTAYTYLGGASEAAIRHCLVQRHPRDAFILADKLPGYLVRTGEDCQRYFNQQLERCGVEYFDVYLLHWLNEANYAICQQFDEFAFLRQLKQAGRVGKIGFSYHDSPELLDRILREHPEVDYVQLQINYLDWDSPALQAAKCYEIAARHEKRVVVMEPVKGGSLAVLPESAEALLREADPDASPASWAIRFATCLEQVEVVLSGMNAPAQMEENMRQILPLGEEERQVLRRAAEIIRGNTAVPCTGCRYCVSHCPQGIPIPDYFALYNDYARNPRDGWKMNFAYRALAEKRTDATACLACRQCEANCPQKLEISSLLKKVEEAFVP